MEFTDNCIVGVKRVKKANRFAVGRLCGFMNPAWGNEFIDTRAADPERCGAFATHDVMERGGVESVEMIIWLAIRSACRRGPPIVTTYGITA